MAGRGNWKGAHWRRTDRSQDRPTSEDVSGNSNSGNASGKWKQSIPPGLKGKEIGLYFRDKNRKKSSENKKGPKKAKLVEVSLDARREADIRQLLKDIDARWARDRAEEERQQRIAARAGPVLSLRLSNEPGGDCDDAGGASSSSTSVPKYTPPHARARLERERQARVAAASAVVGSHARDGYERKYEPPGREYQDRKFTQERDERDYTDWRSRAVKREPKREYERYSDEDGVGPDEYNGRRPELLPNPLHPVNKYRHIGESQFKQQFLENITGSIEQNLERSLTSRSALSRSRATDERLLTEFERQASSRYYRNMLEFRRKLPAYKMREEIIDLVERNQVCVINGETGCGKTTQVAQFILDEYIEAGRGSLCHVVCTQPRRISAISVAERVADERSEDCGRSVGYQIRLERKLPRKQGSILFCTTGVLLQRMQSDAALTEVSHLILDEIHERDTVCDFVLTILKDVIPRRPDLRIILMSATLDAEQFSRYFNNCPMLNIPGYTFPVTEYYLEDILELTGYQSKAAEDMRGWRKHLKHNKSKMRKTVEFQDMIDPYIRQLSAEGKYSQHVYASLRNPETEDVNLDIIHELIRTICRQSGDGAILVFLPGWDKISALNRMLTECGYFPSDRYLIIPLHSLMPTALQKSIFNKPPPGVRKIVLSTCIAETSITIDDVVYVINCGKTKLKNFDVEANISTLKPEWISLANARQRRGRAGRVQAGVCYHTYSRAREQLLANYSLPEMLRTRLEEVILQIKILQLGQVRPFLERVLDPPNPRAVDLSVRLLQGMNALDEEENLTPLGYHLAKLPMDPQTGKMILMGAIFSCVDPVFSVAASLSFKDAFLVPLGQEEKVNQKRDELSGGMKSDHWVIAEAFKRWEEAEYSGRGRSFCWDYFLSGNTLCLLRDMKQQFAENLYQMNFLNSANPKDRDANHNSGNVSLVKAIICAGLYPNVAILQSVKRAKNGMIRQKLITPEDGRVQIHPRSINEREERFESPFLVYHLKLKSTAIYLHDTTMVHALPLLFFGQDMCMGMQDGYATLTVSDALRFRCRTSTANLIKELRERLLRLLEHKITHPGNTDWRQDSSESAVLKAIRELVTYEDNRMQLVAQDGEDFSD